MCNPGAYKVTPSETVKANFNTKYLLGKGGFGEVWKVVAKKTKKEYALKEMSKIKLIK